jgi:hypothetical protein
MGGVDEWVADRVGERGLPDHVMPITSNSVLVASRASMRA